MGASESVSESPPFSSLARMRAPSAPLEGGGAGKEEHVQPPAAAEAGAEHAVAWLGRVEKDACRPAGFEYRPRVPFDLGFEAASAQGAGKETALAEQSERAAPDVRGALRFENGRQDERMPGGAVGARGVEQPAHAAPPEIPRGHVVGEARHGAPSG